METEINTSTPAQAATPPATTAPVTTAPGQAATNTLVTPPPAGNTDAWYGKFTDADLRGYSETKGWQSPEDAVKSIRNLESIIDADKAGRTIVKPTDFNDPAQVAKYYEALGRPKDVKGYEIKAPDGDTSGFAETMAQTMFDHGISKDAAQALLTKYGEVTTSVQEAMQQQKLQVQDNDFNSLKKELGANANSYFAANQGVVRALGLNGDDVQALIDMKGVKGANELLNKMSKGFTESAFAATAGGTGVMTAEAAGAKLSQLKSDKDWSARLMAGGAKELDQFRMLNNIVHGAA